MLVLVEGSRTEKDYLTHWRRENRGNVIVNIPDCHVGPLQLVERAEADKKQQLYDARHGRGQPYDEIWCVFDVDEHAKFDEAVARAAKSDIRIAVSNPCFELWFILHYEDQTAHIERHPAQARSKELTKCKKILTTKALEDLADRYQDAVKRAKALDKKHERDGSPARSNPSSGAWKLVDRIRYPNV
jgi:hypothetical protein